MVYLDLVTLIVRDYDRASAFFTDILGFTIEKDTPSRTKDGRPTRWVEAQ